MGLAALKGTRALPRAQALAARLLHAALTALRDAGGTLPSSLVFIRVEQRVSLDAWAMVPFAESGYKRWESLLHFHSIDALRAGFLSKKHGLWHVTPSGRDALALGEAGLFRAAARSRFSLQAQDNMSTFPRMPFSAESDHDESPSKEMAGPVEDAETGAYAGLTAGALHPTSASDALEQARHLARRSLDAHIDSLDPYRFQELVACLLRAMGYFTPFVAPRGKDGGTDIVAYRDPLGAVPPRVKVQVKHRPRDPARVAEVRELMGVLTKEGDSGLFVSSGGFSADARAAVRNAHVHVELIDRERLVELWKEFFPKMAPEDRMLMPLVPVYFVAQSP